MLLHARPFFMHHLPSLGHDPPTGSTFLVGASSIGQIPTANKSKCKWVYIQYNIYIYIFNYIGT